MQNDPRFTLSTEQPYVDINQTLSNIHKNGKAISWSKMSSYSECKMKWFASNFAAQPTSIITTSPVRDEVKAVPGTIIQKIVEMYIKNGIYMNPLSQIEAWVWENIVALYKIQRYTVEDSKKFPFDTRKYSETPQGKARLHEVLRRHPNADPSVLNKWKPQFFNVADLQEGSEQAFLEHMYNTTLKSLSAFHDKFKMFNKLHTEAFIRAQFMNTIALNGGIDFMYDPMGLPMRHNTKAEPAMGFQIWDGKWNVNSYTKVGQLHFYAYMFHLRNSKIPTQVGFFDWQRQLFLPQPCTLEHFNKLKNVIYAINTTQKELKKEFEGLSKHKNVALFDISDRLSMKPSESSCRFCEIRSVCPSYMPKTEGASKVDFPLPASNSPEVTFDEEPKAKEAASVSSDQPKEEPKASKEKSDVVEEKKSKPSPFL